MLPLVVIAFAVLGQSPGQSVGSAVSPTTVPDANSQLVWRRATRFQLLGPPEQRANLGLYPKYGSWEQLRVLGTGRFGTWSLRGMIAGLGPGCSGDLRSRCSALADAGISIAWTPRGSLISFFGGVVFTSSALATQVGASRRAKATPMVVGGIVVALPSMLDVVKLARGIPIKWRF